jgi:hypothetical protein
LSKGCQEAANLLSLIFSKKDPIAEISVAFFWNSQATQKFWAMEW